MNGTSGTDLGGPRGLDTPNDLDLLRQPAMRGGSPLAQALVPPVVPPGHDRRLGVVPARVLSGLPKLSTFTTLSTVKF